MILAVADRHAAAARLAGGAMPPVELSIEVFPPKGPEAPRSGPMSSSSSP